MSHSGKRNSDLGFDTLSDQFRHMLSSDENKPDFRELNFGSPVSPLQTRRSGPSATASGQTTTSTSSSSSGSVSGSKPPANRSDKGPKDHSGELSGSSENSPTAARSLRSPTNARTSKPGQAKSDSGQSSPSSSSANSPALNVLPAGNICPSGKILKTGMATNRTAKSDVLGYGTGNYGHGNIMRGGGASKPTREGALKEPAKKTAAVARSLDPEKLKRVGNEQYRSSNFAEALSLYDRAIALSPGNAAYRSNRAAALTALGRLDEAVKECEEAVRLDTNYGRAHQRLASLYLRLGQIENAKKHFFCHRQQPDPSELQKLQSVEKQISKCTISRRAGEWKSVLREIDAAVDAGADSSPQLFMCRAEALLKLHQIDEAASILLNIPKTESLPKSSFQEKFFGMLSEAYFLFVGAQVDMALGRFESAVTVAEKAKLIDPQSTEVAVLLTNIRIVARARARGNDLFNSERFTEACSAYEEGLRRDPANSVLYCNRAACFFKLRQWDRAIEDCNRALQIQPNYAKALLRRAASYNKLEKWGEAIKDYEVLRRMLPDNNDVSEALFHARVALKKSRGEEVSNLKFGGEVEAISSLEQFRAAISLPGVSIVYFAIESNSQCKQISPFVNTLCIRYPSISFLKVDIQENPAVATVEDISIVPTFKIYKNSNRVKELICPSHDLLEHSVRHYSL
ncbi:TPR repeat-containing thioredoxin TTL1-like [Senna tora]|uniref:TPR repeat-containing thioredoxin TTL1-like n=1 Tax=Senna tora TaxID=362788 RepID=A0A834TIC9_9FABA|nr:TPR repeat-containing thioredoxin TTL1-like [Senna tora]